MDHLEIRLENGIFILYKITYNEMEDKIVANADPLLQDPNLEVVANIGCLLATKLGISICNNFSIES